MMLYRLKRDEWERSLKLNFAIKKQKALIPPGETVIAASGKVTDPLRSKNMTKISSKKLSSSGMFQGSIGSS